MSADIDGARERDNAWLADREAYEREEIPAWVSSEVRHDRHVLLAEIDRLKADVERMEDEQDIEMADLALAHHKDRKLFLAANRAKREYRHRATDWAETYEATEAENADMRETLETISQIGSHKMDREAAQHCLDRHKGQT